MGYYSKKKYFGFGANSGITSKKGKKREEKPKEKTGGVFILGVVVPTCGKCKRRRKGNPELN